MFLVSIALAAVCLFQKKTIRKQSSRTETMQVQYKDLALRSASMEKELARKKEIVEQVPLIVRKLSETIPPSAIPPTVVRFAKDFFKASKVGYFTPTEGSDEFILVEGAGIAPNLLRKIRVSSDEGILGAALQKRIIVAKSDDLVSAGMRIGRASLENAGLDADLVAPVYVDAKIVGVLVLVGCHFDIGSERQYVSMLADLLAGALKTAMVGESLKTAGSIDELTGLYSRSYFAQWFENEIRRAKNYLAPLSIFLFDIDHFKAVNDTHGHPAGDLVLRKLAAVVRRQTRSSDLVARYGGEEFVVVMTSSDKDQAFVYADQLRRTIAETRISIPGVDTPITITVSGGVASFPQDGDTTTSLIHAADQALYGAKRRLRNEVVLAQSVGLDGRPIAPRET